MGINYSGYSIRCVMKTIDEFKRTGANDTKYQNNCKGFTKSEHTVAKLQVSGTLNILRPKG